MTMLGKNVVLASLSCNTVNLNREGLIRFVDYNCYPTTPRPRASGQRVSSDFISGRGSPTMNCMIPLYPKSLLPHIHTSLHEPRFAGPPLAVAAVSARNVGTEYLIALFAAPVQGAMHISRCRGDFSE